MHQINCSNLTVSFTNKLMVSSLGSVMTNVFMCHLEEQVTTNLADNFPTLYMRYWDDSLVSMPRVPSAQHFLVTLNNLHANLNFTMELPCDNKISFTGFEIVKNGTFLERKFTRNLPTLVCYYIIKVM